MFSHVNVGTNDPDRAERFYGAVMPLLGQPELFRVRGNTIAYGALTGPKLFVGPPFDERPAAPGNGHHLAFIVQDRATVDAFHAAALAHGGSDEGAPGPRPQYHANYYGAYVRDPGRQQAAGSLPRSAEGLAAQPPPQPHAVNSRQRCRHARTIGRHTTNGCRTSHRVREGADGRGQRRRSSGSA